MKEGIHPEYHSEAQVICACGNTWTTGSTQAVIKTDLCSNCHPFYTGEQRIVDTEGQVDRFLKRLQARDSMQDASEQRQEAKTSPELPVTELELGKRYEKALQEAGINTTGDILAALEEGGDTALLDIKGFGQKSLIDMKKALRARGYQLPEPENA